MKIIFWLLLTWLLGFNREIFIFEDIFRFKLVKAFQSSPDHFCYNTDKTIFIYIILVYEIKYLFIKISTDKTRLFSFLALAFTNCFKKSYWKFIINKYRSNSLMFSFIFNKNKIKKKKSRKADPARGNKILIKFYLLYSKDI